MSGEMQIIAQVLAVLLSPFIVQLLKGAMGITGDGALYLTYLISLVLGGFVAAVGGTLPPFPAGDPALFAQALIEWGAVVFAVATFIYKVWLAKVESGPLATHR